MSIYINNDSIVIPLSSILESMSSDQCSEFAQSASIENEIFDAVLDQIVEGFTQNVSRVDSDRLTKARTRILEAIDPIRMAVIRKLMEAAAVRKFVEDRTTEWAWSMWHSWPEGSPRPDVPRDFNPQYPTDAEVAAKANET